MTKRSFACYCVSNSLPYLHGGNSLPYLQGFLIDFIFITIKSGKIKSEFNKFYPVRVRIEISVPFLGFILLSLRSLGRRLVTAIRRRRTGGVAPNTQGKCSMSTESKRQPTQHDSVTWGKINTWKDGIILGHRQKASVRIQRDFGIHEACGVLATCIRKRKERKWSRERIRSEKNF